MTSRSLSSYFGNTCCPEFSRMWSFFNDLEFGLKRGSHRTGGHPGRGEIPDLDIPPGSPRTGRRVGQTKRGPNSPSGPNATRSTASHVEPGPATAPGNEAFRRLR